MMKKQAHKTQLLILVVIFFLASVIISQSGLFSRLRVDLTENDLFTLNKGTVNILQSIDERIHLKQQRELLIIPFYFIYLLEWLLRTLLYLNSYRAYQNISFEREAYANERDMNYLSRRKAYSFLNYLMR